MKAARRRIQFFDPILKTQKLALDASNQDDILGDRDVDQKSVSKLSLFTMSPCGNWMATVESNWDTMNGNCLKIWNFTNQVKREFLYQILADSFKDLKNGFFRYRSTFGNATFYLWLKPNVSFFGTN